jgi:hypothetical protein
MHQSTIVPGRQSVAIGTSQGASAAALAAAQRKLLAKKREYEGVAALERASDVFVKRMLALAEDTESMADAGQCTQTHTFVYSTV